MNIPQLDQHPYSELDDASNTNDPIGRFSLLDDVDLSSEAQGLAIEELTSDYPNSTSNSGFLTRLHKSEPLVKQSASLVMDAICAIPEQMLRRETFPPFIHPHWNRPAMPEPLAICMRIAQMFASRTPDIKPFIWRTILAEQRRILKQVRISFPLLYKFGLLTWCKSCTGSLSQTFLLLCRQAWYILSWVWSIPQRSQLDGIRR